MSQSETMSTSASTLKRAFAAIDGLQRELAAVRRERTEPIAVVGLGCRFPGGVVDADSYWNLLENGVDAITEIPADRWDVDAFYQAEAGHPGKMSTRWGGFLDDLDQFDAAFFGISAREAEAMDPNQRLVLEVSWEALENAGYARLAGTRTGVFVGAFGSDYGIRQFSHPEDVSPYAVTGNAHSMISGRLAYLLDLRGPAVSIDTACSSSLVALHLACQSLRTGDVDLALAGGVNVILSPLATIGFSQFGMMATDGRCRTFDARATGFVRGEGCGMVVLKRLSDAVADGDDVLAVIRGGAINQDGRGTGLTAPNVFSQRELLRRALKSSGVAAEQVSYIEGHGTATPLGDPIEVEALAEVYPSAPDVPPWHLGSVKTNFGHLEGAAGIAGFIKVVLSLRHQAIPPHLHFEHLNPHIALERPPFTIPTRLTEWVPRSGRRIAGVSAFGLSGTNVHLLVEQGPVRPPVVEDTSRPLSVLALSARSETGLRRLIERHCAQLAGASPVSVADHCYSSNTGRAQFAHRLAVIGGSAPELDAALLRALDRQDSPAPSGGRKPELTFLFSGEGTERPGMAQALYESAPAFRQTLQRCDALLRGELEIPLLDVLFPQVLGSVTPDRPTLAQSAQSAQATQATQSTQAALFAVEYALAEQWRAWGVEPTAVLGHGLGEVVAACTAGVMSLEGALRLVIERARLAEVGLDSPPTEPMLAAFRQAVAQIPQSPPRIPFVSGMTGTLWPWDEAPDTGYWVQQTIAPVRFADGVETLRGLGHSRFLEIGPDPVLLGLIGPLGSDQDQLRLPSIAAGQDDWRTMLSSLAALYGHGTDVDWAGFDRGYRRTRVPVPTSPFVRSRHWYDSPNAFVPAAPRDGDGSAEPAGPDQPAGSDDQVAGTLTRQSVLALAKAERFDVLSAHIGRGVGTALGSARRPRLLGAAPAVEVSLDQPLLDLGLDSLMAIGLRNQIRTQLGVILPIASLLQGASVRTVSTQVLAGLAEDEVSDPGEPPPTDDPPLTDDQDALLAELRGMSEVDVAALLGEGR
jgi:acyl transferase domain-containing protein